MVAHVYPFTRYSRFSEVLRPVSVGPAVSRIFLVLLLFSFPLLGAAGQTWQLRASLVELPGGVLVDPAQPAGIGFRGFTGITLLTGDLARLSHPGGEVSAFYHLEPLDGGAERMVFRLSDGRTVEMVRVAGAPGRYHFLYRLDPDFFTASDEPAGAAPEGSVSESETVLEGADPEKASDAMARQAKDDPAGVGGEASKAEPQPRVLYMGTMTGGN